VAGHEDALRLFYDRASPKRSLQVLILAESLQCDVDRALQLISGSVDDVGEYPAFGSFVNVRRVACVKNCDHGAGGFANDLRDQLEGML